MEPMGIVLATIPLVVTVLDKYVETLDTVSLFRTEKYRRHIERYSSVLQGQQASLVNAVEIALGVQINEDDIQSIRVQSENTASTWKDRALQDKLQKNLGRDYEVFVNIITDARHVLQELSHRLKEDSDPSTATQPRAILVARRVKTILSKRRYNNLLGDLNTSIDLLQRIVDQSLQRQERIRADRGSRREIVRSPAASIYKALLREKFWTCSCRDKHSVLLTLDLDLRAAETSEIVFRIALATVNDPAQSLFSWQEIEVEPRQNQSGTIQITQLCSTFSTIGVMTGGRKIVGSLIEGEYQHMVSVTRSNIGILESQSLEELLMSSTLAAWIPGFYFPKGDRLHLATRLAWSVLQFHGNWLREHWRTRDILFPRETGGTNSQNQTFLHPCLSWRVSSKDATSPGPSSAIASKVLFPLALALIELSLCRSFSALKRPEDENPEEVVTLLKTANRCISSVSEESGERYGMVVRRCLHWSETKETDPDDEQFRAAFCKSVVAPLMDVMAAFDGDSGTCVGASLGS
ncbi:hypothetical protein BDV11DRAFT_172652 [Aspergillus similis]